MITEKVCFTSQPPALDYLPLPNGKADVFMRKNIESAETEDGTVYYADEAYMRITNGSPSQAEIVAGFDEWYDTAAAWQQPTPTKKPDTQEARIAALEEAVEQLKEGGETGSDNSEALASITEELQALKIILGVE